MKCVILPALLLIAVPVLAQPMYSGAYGGYPHCENCHSSIVLPQFHYWSETPHAGAWDDHPEVQYDADCLPCHSTGWDLAQTNGGFDDYFFAGDTTGMLQMRNVQCESCHGPTNQTPHPASTVVDYNAGLCGDCHNGHGGSTFEEWADCRHGQTAPSTPQQLACAKCHEAASAAHYLRTGQAPSALPADPVWQITCASCHLTHDRGAVGAQLPMESDSLCAACHNMQGATVGQEPHSPQYEMLMGIGYGGFEWPGYYYTNSCHWSPMVMPNPCVNCHMYTDVYGNPDTTTTGHSLQIPLQACIDCHELYVPPDSSYNFFSCNTVIDSLLAALAAELALADTSTLEYAQAKFNYDFVVRDGSRGVHNFFYARDLLISSLEGLPVGVADPGPPSQPAFLRLESVHPNPFNAGTRFTVELPGRAWIRLAVYDLAGRCAAVLHDGWMESGRQEIPWTPAGMASGLYFYRMESAGAVQVGKVVLLQ